ncbi:hypothetical protein DMENIID0001_150870 [Sergentomyia squamirostris]
MKEFHKIPRRARAACKKVLLNEIPSDKQIPVHHKNCQIICCRPNFKYIQPPKQRSLKPLQENHLSGEPFRGDTIYRKSYYGVSGDRLIQCRPEVVRRPTGEIMTKMDDAAMPRETVFTMSYKPHQGVIQQRAILPKAHKYTSGGPFEGVTTHKHDYVTKKVLAQAEKIVQAENVERPRGKLSEDTVNRLSYTIPVGASRTMSFKPKILYQPPSEAFDANTIHRLSYQPTPLQAREILPWARKDKYSPPLTPMERDTVYRMSYLDNPHFRPPKPIKPSMGKKILDVGETFNSDTIYRMSFQPSKIVRVPPIVHRPELSVLSGIFEKDTIHRLSYLHPDVDARRQSMRPQERKMINSAPMESLTTHLKSFVLHPLVRQPPYKPKSSELSLSDSHESLEKDTIHKLSYLPPNMENFQPARSYKPELQEFRSEAPFDGRTVNKLSFLPPPAGLSREPIPWAKKDIYVRPTEKMEDNTIHRMSYQPPGQRIFDGTYCCCTCPIESSEEYPKAGL